MSRILLADDSPHAQRMGERILREEGFEVVSLTDGDAAVLRLADVDPDLILADVFLPGKSGFDLCRHVKSDPHLRHVRVVLTAGLLEPFDEAEATRAGCDAILKKPFEASKVMETIHPLVKEARDMIAAGVKAKITCVDPAQVDRTFAGRDFDQALLDSLPPGVDPCGENGEFHTFVYDAPMFSSPIEVRMGEVVERDGFVFADVLPE